MLGLRVATAAVLLGVFAAALFLAPLTLWIAFCALALAGAAWEWGRLARFAAAGNVLFTAALVVALLFVCEYPGAAAWRSWLFAATGVFWMIAAPLWLWKRPAVKRALLAATGALVLVSAFAALVVLRDWGGWTLLALMAIVWVSDTAAFFGGRRFGRRKLAPAISPGKTWEGLWSAIAAILVYAGLLAAFAPDVLPARGQHPMAAVVAAALFFALLGVVGDLFESQLKRAAGVKDSGMLLPGHGGVLDRVDALLPVLPVAAWLFSQ
jgi:phosphatidate cytidylyltransferase